MHPYPCRLGRWTLAQLLVHELVHITLVPGQDQEGLAYGMEKTCGLMQDVRKITVVGAPSLAPTVESELPDQLVDQVSVRSWPC